MPTTMPEDYNMLLTEDSPKVSKHNKVLKETEKDRLNQYKANQKTYCKLILVCHREMALGIVNK